MGVQEEEMEEMEDKFLESKRGVLLSPILLFTSEPTPRPPRLPISLIITIQPLSSIVPFRSPLFIILSDPFLLSCD